MEPFFKYHALGNDFVIVDRRATAVDLDAATTRALCDRHFGIGADGVLALLPSPGAAARMVVHNADGSVAQMCGNGIRCVARFLAEADPGRPERLTIDTGAGRLECALAWDGASVSSVTVDMGQARWEAPVLPNGGPFLAQPVRGEVGTAVSMGNPHFVLLSTPASLAARLGPLLETDPVFPERTNVEFVRVAGERALEVVVWERGVGLTLACGTGACAAVAECARVGKVPFDAWVQVALPGGLLEVKVQAGDHQVQMRGPARFVFQGALPA